VECLLSTFACRNNNTAAAAAPVVPWRSVPKSVREEIVTSTTAFVLQRLATLKHIPPSGREYATLLKLTYGIGIGESTARGLFASKKEMVAVARSRRQKMKSRRNQEYLKWCAEVGRAPGALAGVDFRTW